jgi:hypothetical protein
MGIDESAVAKSTEFASADSTVHISPLEKEQTTESPL